MVNNFKKVFELMKKIADLTGRGTEYTSLRKNIHTCADLVKDSSSMVKEADGILIKQRLEDMYNYLSVGLEKLHLDELDYEILSRYNMDELKESKMKNIFRYNQPKDDNENTQLKKVIFRAIDFFTKIQHTSYNVYDTLFPLYNLFYQEVSINMGIIEVEFIGKTDIDNISSAKKQIENWYLILDGYARLLKINRDEFVFSSITKESPTTIIIIATLGAVSLVLGIISDLITLEKRNIEDSAFLDQLKGKNYIRKHFGKEVIDNMDSILTKQIEECIEKIVDSKLEAYKIDVKNGEGDIKASLYKAVENQYKFLVNGGNVNFIIDHSEELKQTVLKLEINKSELVKLKQGKETKSITDSTETK